MLRRAKYISCQTIVLCLSINLICLKLNSPLKKTRPTAPLQLTWLLDFFDATGPGNVSPAVIAVHHAKGKQTWASNTIAHHLILPQ